MGSECGTGYHGSIAIDASFLPENRSGPSASISLKTKELEGSRGFDERETAEKGKELEWKVLLAENQGKPGNLVLYSAWELRL
jgi:hypothetical protein